MIYTRIQSILYSLFPLCLGADATLVDDKDFIASINRIRLSRFDDAITEVMNNAKESKPGKMEKEDLKNYVKVLTHCYSLTATYLLTYSFTM